MWDTVHLRVFDQSYVVSAGAMRRTHFYYEWRVVGKKVRKFRFGGKWKRFFGSPDWKMPGKNGTARKVVLLIPVGTSRHATGFSRCNCNIPVFLIKLSLPFRKENGGRDYDVPVLAAPSMEHLLSHDCSPYKNGK